MSRVFFVLIFVLILVVGTILGFYKIHTILSDIEINTSSPQSSSSVSDSKKDKLFEVSFQSDSVPVGIEIKEAWVENVWKNTKIHEQIIKEKLGGLQLLLNIVGIENYGYRESNFLIDWEMKLDKGVQIEGIGCGRGNGLYVFYIKEKIPKKIKVLLYSTSNSKYFKPLTITMSSSPAQSNPEIRSFSSSSQNKKP